MLARPAVTAVYTIAGRRILIAARDTWSAQAVASLFAGWFLKPASENGNGAPDVTLNIQCGAPSPPIPHGFFKFDIPQGGICHTDGDSFYLDFYGSRVVIGPGLKREIDIWVEQQYEFGSKVLAQIISQAFSAALRRCGLFEFHSAGLVPPRRDKAVLIAGDSGSGKSTLTLQLALCGWNFLSDDTLLLDKSESGIEVHALRKFFAFTPETIAGAQLTTSSSRPRVPQQTSTNAMKERVTPQELFPDAQIQRSKPGSIFFTTVTHEAESRVEPLTPAEGMSKLLRLCPWAAYDKPAAAEHLGMLAALARETTMFSLFAGRDLLEDPERASNLCLREARV